MRTLNHSSIIRMLEFIETKEYFFLILELMDGGEIFHQIVQLTYFSEDLARHCIKQVAEGIRYLHEERGVVHRDIKPENILFESIPLMERKSSPLPTQPEDDDEPKEDEGEFVAGVGGGGIGKVKIADFGLSKVVWDKHTMTPCGTVGYTAPEIVRDERYSKSVDMWALGCVLYTMLCGFPPFYDESIPTLTQKVAKGHYTFLSPWWDHISDEVKHLIQHLLDINPKKRYTIDQFLAHPWIKMNEAPKTATHTTTETTTATTTATSEVTEEPTGQERRKSSPGLIVPPSTTTSVAAETISIVPSSPQNIPKNNNSSNNHSSRRKEMFLSGITSMKEAFDVSYAVHRMGEERAQRKEAKKQQMNNPYSVQNRFKVFNAPIMNDHDEDDEDVMAKEDLSDPSSFEEEEVQSQINSLCNDFDSAQTMTEKKPSSNDNLLIKKLAGKFHDSPPTVNRKARKSFELNMGKATLLGRRKNVPTL
ncbi:kinase-like domain-containing protein [Thamnidium elegans]|nr:kinase-like domain-containing protein [Thamnidium elegans]